MRQAEKIADQSFRTNVTGILEGAKYCGELIAAFTSGLLYCCPTEDRTVVTGEPGRYGGRTAISLAQEKIVLLHTSSWTSPVCR